MLPRFTNSQSLAALASHSPPATRHALRPLLLGFIIAAVGVLGRLVVLEFTYGDEYRSESARLSLKYRVRTAPRGRILARDGTVLVSDRPVASLAIDYRELENPPDARWLRAQARARLSARERRNPDRMKLAQEEILAERDEASRRLQDLCGITQDEWLASAMRVQGRVRTLAEGANRAARERYEQQLGGTDDSDAHAAEGWLSAASRRLFISLFRVHDEPPQSIVVAEELAEHIVCRSISMEAVAEIEGHPDRYRGAHVIYGSRRVYAAPELAPHAIGYVSRSRDSNASESVGQAGIERQYDSVLQGHDGVSVDRLDRRGRLISSTVEREAIPGRDLMLTLDPALQATAQTLLDNALARRIGLESEKPLRSSGGAIVAIDVRSGAMLAAASAPRFDLVAFATGDAASIRQSLDGPAHPLLDRAIQMALPPGSVFKTLAAMALVHQPGFDPERPFTCEGYLHSPDSRRCMIYRRTGVGHGPVTLIDAIARSCNVYFFQQAEQMGPAPLLDWAGRGGFGRPTGIDLPGESAGRLPAIELAAENGAQPTTSAERHRARVANEEGQSFAVGQGELTTTPLQIVRLMAAIANGGDLVTPHIAARLELPPSDGAPGITENSFGDSDRDDNQLPMKPPAPIPGLDSKKLGVIREALRQVVADPQGTGHATVALESIAIAGKTGTAEVGGGAPDHSWFAGYAPADAPRIAFVVAIEHGGEASTLAGPVAKHLVEKLQSLGYFRRSERRSP